MNMTIDFDGQRFDVAWQNPLDISMPLQFDGAQPRFFGAPAARQNPLAAGGFVGDTRQGGSCNVDELRLIPHCNGTHTECIGHIAEARISLHDTLKKAFFLAQLITITPESAGSTSDQYRPALQQQDKVITAAALRQAWHNQIAPALVIRTLPNLPAKKFQDYDSKPAPFFSLDAMKLIAASPVQHLLVDLPSLDRGNDDGLMAAHHLYWEVPQGSNRVDPASCSLKTVTEMIYVPDEIADGLYLLNLQCPGFMSDAVPSRPLLFALSSAR